MLRLRSGPLAAWATAWLTGQVGSDDVLRAAMTGDAPHQVSGLDGADGELAPLSEALILWRRAGGLVRVVLPVAGDVRGLPGPAAFRSAAIEAGEAVCGGGIGLVPEVTEFGPSSALPTVLWRAFALDTAPPDYLAVSDAQYELTTAIGDCAAALMAGDVGGTRDDIADALRDARRAGERLNLPPGHPPRAVALLAQAERLQAVLDLAAKDPVGGAIDRHGIAVRASALTPLATPVRRARMASYNAGVTE